MKHDNRARRRSVRMTEYFWRGIEEWRAGRLARQALAEISRRENGHLLDDIGIDSADVYRRDRMQRHCFWML
jgi:uncharacterized protein YjiS (DUF1127 family)